MPFDGFTVAAVTSQINRELKNSRVERVNAPTSDEIVLNLRTEDRRSVKLCLSASSNIPKVNITDVVKDNPMQASALCMHLRKHLNSAKLLSAEQPGFERVIKLTMQTTDELGFPRTEYIYAEIMGKYSNVILTDENDRIIENEIGSYKQFPLTLGYAMTIHKSQGKTLSKVIIDISRGAFAHGQTYVALSRTRSAKDMHIVKPLTYRDVIFDKRILNEY